MPHRNCVFVIKNKNLKRNNSKITKFTNIVKLEEFRVFLVIELCGDFRIQILASTLTIDVRAEHRHKQVRAHPRTCKPHTHTPHTRRRRAACAAPHAQHVHAVLALVLGLWPTHVSSVL